MTLPSGDSGRDSLPLYYCRLKKQKNRVIVSARMTHKSRLHPYT